MTKLLLSFAHIYKKSNIKTQIGRFSFKLKKLNKSNKFLLTKILRSFSYIYEELSIYLS